MIIQMTPEEMIAMMKQAKMMDDGQIEQMVMMKAQQMEGQQPPAQQQMPMTPGSKRFKGLARDMAENVASMRRAKGRVM